MIKSFSPNELELGSTDMSKKTGIPIPTAYRILSTFAEADLLEKNVKTGKYKIGPAFYALGSLYLSTIDVTKVAEPVIKMLNNLTNEAVTVAILNKGNIVLVMEEESKYSFRFADHIGSIYPAYATAVGKMLLSELTETELDGLYPEERLEPVTKKTIATKTELKIELEQIRKTGVAFNSEGTFEGAEAIGCAIRDASGRIVAAIGLPVPLFRMNQTNRERIATLVRLGSSLVSYRLGYQDPVNPVRDIEEIRSWWEQNRIDSTS